MPNVVDAVLADGDPFRSHAEGEAAEAFGIIAAILQHRGVDHACAHSLQPAAPLAHAAALAAAADAVHVDFDARFGEREVARTDAHLPVLAEHPPRECDDGPLQVGHGHAAADDQAFHLVELDLAARGDRLVAVTHARQDHANRLRAEFAH